MKKKTTLRALLSGCILISSTFAIAQPCTPPTGVSASPVAVCLGNPVTLSATRPATTTSVNWYTVATGGTAIATTTSTTTTYTPTAAGTYTFYAESAAGSGGGGGTPQNFLYTGAVQSVTLQPGTYTLECWGADGGDALKGTGGKGGYAQGTLTVAAATVYYIYAGGKGSTASAPATGGWNGGGSFTGTFTTGYNGGTGGGGTDIRTTLNTVYTDRIIVAGGGGGGTGYSTYTGNGGDGGGVTGANGSSTRGATYAGGGGTAVAGGTSATGGIASYSLPGALGIGGNYAGTLGGTAGGGGYYGGGSGHWGGSGGGGSGYIGGVTSGTTFQISQTGFVANPDATGNGYVRITPTSSGCVSTRVATAVVTVYALPTVAITPATADICSGSSIGLTASGATTYSWSPATGLSATVGNAVTASPTTTTTYTVTGTANGCNATATRTVTVSTPPVAGTLTGTQTVCAGSTTTFSVSGNSATGTWSSGSTGVATVNSSGVVTGVLAGTDTITYTVAGTGPCSNAITTRTVTVLARPDTSFTITPMTANICTGQTATLTTASAAGTTYIWYKDGSVIPGATSNIYGATIAGDYRVFVSNGTCSDTSAAKTITVVARPIATITSPSTVICQGSTLTLTGPAPVTGVTYQWQLNGSDITGATSDTYVASISGNYRLVLSNGTCADTSTVTTLTVNPLPTATATPGGPLSFCTGGSVVLTANSGTGITYRWYRNGFFITGATGLTYTANNSGSYNVLVTNTATGCADTSRPPIVVTLYTTPGTTLNATGSLTFCQGSSVTLQASAGTGYTYVWYRNAAVITGATAATYVATTAGTYYVVVTNGPCTSTSVTRTVVVNPLPTATATAAGPVNFCIGGSVVINGNTGTGLTYQWRLNATNITGATSASYTATASGSYTVVVSNGTCTNTSNAVLVTVSAMPAPVITSVGTPTFCQGNSVTLQATTGAGYTYQWQLNTVNIAGATASNFSATASGNYTVTITNGTCVATSAPFAVSVTPAPPAVITPAGPTSFCQGDHVVLNANRATGYTYQWTLNAANIPGATGYSYTASATGNYSVNIFDGTCPAVAAAVSVIVNNFPVAVITVTAGVNLSTTTFASYQWYRNGVLITGATSQNYTAVQDGFYAVLVTDALGCSATSSVQQITSLDVNNAGAAQMPVTIWPNPVETVLNINAAHAVNISILSIDGKELLKAENAKKIDISYLPQGLYLVRISDHKTGALIKVDKINKK